jgi:hypothetical protein
LICIFFLNLLFFKIIWCCIVELTFPFPRWTQPCLSNNENK